MKNNYIFVVIDDYWDAFSIELVTTDFKNAFEQAYEHNGSIEVWIDGKNEAIISVDVNEDCDEIYSSFIKAKDTIYNDLVEIALPIIENQRNIYLEKKHKEEELKAEKIRERELKELARLKAKYEGIQ